MRLILNVEGGELAGREFVLQGGALSLGRDEACGVRFGPADTQVSRRHAQIRRDEQGFSLSDQQSTNGTHVNDEKIDSVHLRSGDLIELGTGGPRLRVRIEQAPPRAAEAADAPATSRVDVAFYDPAHDKRRRTSALSLVVVLGMMVFGGFFGLLVALITTFELGPLAAAVGVTVAFAPAPLYLVLWLWLDRYDPEPVWVLAGGLAWGAGAATFVSSVANTVFTGVMLSVTQHEGMARFLSASISAPFVEEATKGLAVLLIFLVLRREFDGVLDGIVYAGVVALGFATVENVLYYGRVAAKEGAPGLLAVFAVRGVLGPFGHSVFTSMTGIGCGIARQSHNTLVRWLAPPLGYAAAVFLHFLWNTLAGLSGGLGGFLVLYVIVWAPLFLAFAVAVIWMGHRESRLIRRVLEPEVALGLITQEQLAMVGSWPRRVRFVLAALGDRGRLAARRQFLHALTRLALSYGHAERAARAGGETLSAGLIPIYRTEVARLRGAV
jgi:RsiW-degrading membrane proteinase PrsW (M82 family)